MTDKEKLDRIKTVVSTWDDAAWAKWLKTPATVDDKHASETAAWARLDKFDAAWDAWELEHGK